MDNTIEVEITDLLLALRAEAHDVHELRKRIAEVILRALPEVGRRETYWAKVNFVHACRAFEQNMRTASYSAPCDTWLTYCLVQLRDAFLPKGTYNENYVPRERDIERLAFSELGNHVRRRFEPLVA